MKISILLLLASTVPALSGECYSSTEDPASRVILNGARVNPNVILEKPGVRTEMTLYGAGTGLETMMAVPDDENSTEAYSVGFEGETLIFDGKRFTAGCK